MACPPNCSCMCGKKVIPASVKELSKADGSTQWEYGPLTQMVEDANYSQIVGVEPSQSTPSAFNEYGLTGGASAYADIANKNYGTGRVPNRALGYPTANISSGNFKLTTLNMSDGSVASNPSIDWMYVRRIISGGGLGGPTVYSYTLANVTIPNSGQASARGSACVTTSGGYCCLWRVDPLLELNDYNSASATRDYTLHPHSYYAPSATLQCKLTFRNSENTISLDWDETASSLQTALNAESDITSATVTGGPWPYTALDISITWADADYDFGYFQNFPTTYTFSSPPFIDPERQSAASAIVISQSDGSLGSYFTAKMGDPGSGDLINDGGGPVPTGLGRRNIARIFADGSKIVATSGTGEGEHTVECWTPNTSGWSSNWRYINNFNTPNTAALQGVIKDVHNGNAYLLAPLPGLYNTSNDREGAQIAISSGTVTEISPTDLQQATAIVSPDWDYDYNQWDEIQTSASIAYVDNSSDVVAYNREVKFESGYPEWLSRWTGSGNQSSTSAVANFEPSWSRDSVNGTTWMGVYHADSSDSLVRIGEIEDNLRASNNRRFPVPNPIRDQTDYAFGWEELRGADYSYVVGGIAGGYTGSAPYTYSLLLKSAGVTTDGSTEWALFIADSNLNVTYLTDWMRWDISEANLQTELDNTFGSNTHPSTAYTNNAKVAAVYATHYAPSSNNLLEDGIRIDFAAEETWSDPYNVPNHDVYEGHMYFLYRNVTEKHSGGIKLADRSTLSVTWSRDFGTPISSTVSPILSSGGSHVWLRSSAVYAMGPYVENDLP